MIDLRSTGGCEPPLELLGESGRVAKVIAGGGNGCRYALGRRTGDSGDFADAKPFQGVEDKSLAMGGANVAESGSDEAHHFIGTDDLFGS